MNSACPRVLNLLTKSDDWKDESGIGGGIHFRAFFSQIMTLAGRGFAFAPALQPTLSISHQGLVHFSISKLISRQSLSILMRVTLVPSLTGGETEGKNSWQFIIKGCEPALRRCCRLYVFKCFYLSAAKLSLENISAPFPRWSNYLHPRGKSTYYTRWGENTEITKK